MPSDLIELALFNDDLDLLSYLIGLGEDFSEKSSQTLEDSSNKQTSFAINHKHFLYAIKAGRPHLLAELIKRTGSGIPLEKFAKSSGVELTEKPNAPWKLVLLQVAALLWLQLQLQALCLRPPGQLPHPPGLQILLLLLLLGCCACLHLAQRLHQLLLHPGHQRPLLLARWAACLSSWPLLMVLWGLQGLTESESATKQKLC